MYYTLSPINSHIIESISNSVSIMHAPFIYFSSFSFLYTSKRNNGGRKPKPLLVEIPGIDETKRRQDRVPPFLSSTFISFTFFARPITSVDGLRGSRETVFVRINSSLNPPPSRKEKEKERNALANRGEETLIKFLARLYAFKSFSLSLFLFQSNVHELRPLVQFLHAAISALYLLGGNPCATIYSKADFSESIGHGESTGWWRE